MSTKETNTRNGGHLYSKVPYECTSIRCLSSYVSTDSIVYRIGPLFELLSISFPPTRRGIFQVLQFNMLESIVRREASLTLKSILNF